MENYQNAGSGLKMMFIAELGTIICTVLMVIPIINILAVIGALVFLIISMVGLYSAGKDIEGCKTAFYITIINMVVSVLNAIFKTGIVGTIFTLAGSVLSLLVVYYVCTSVAEALQTKGAADYARKGLTVWKINLVCTIITMVITVLNLLPFMVFVTAIVTVVVGIVSLVAMILYMIFLYNSYKVFGA